jgi:hypothetical protein
MPLCYITENNNDARRDYLRKYGVNMKHLNEYFQQDIIQSQVKEIDHKIAEQLDPSLHFRITEYDILHQEKTDREAYTKSHE